MVVSEVALSGLIAFGEPLRPTADTLKIPTRLIEPHELAYRMAGAYQDFREGDVIIVEPREEAASGEKVIATFKGNVYIGNWWRKHRKNQLIVDPSLQPMNKVKVIGVINCVVRFS